MAYTAKNYDSLIGMQGFSETLLKNHFTLYQGYVTNTNKLNDALKTMARDAKTGTPEYAELKRRFGWEFNGMRLHELYFGNMNKTPQEPPKDASFGQGVKNVFGSFDTWQTDFKASGTMRGIGWVVLYQDSEKGELFNTWVNEHDIGHLTTAKPLLVLDVFEHAYMIDY